MTRRLLRPIGTVLLIAVALVTPTVVTTSAPASADMVVDGCTVVSNPTPTHFTNCPNANLAGANLAGVDLSYANLAGASFMECPVYGMAAHCTGANLTDATLTDANLSGASFFSVAEFLSPAFVDVHGANFSGADLLQAALDTGLDFSDDNLSGANLTGDTLGDTFVNTNLSDANLNGASMGYSFDGFIAPANLEGANLTGTLLVPPNKSVTATSQAGARGDVADAVGDSGCDARKLHSSVGIHLSALLDHRDLPGPRPCGRRGHGDIPGERAADDPVLHPSRCPLRRSGPRWYAPTSTRGRLTVRESPRSSLR